MGYLPAPLTASRGDSSTFTTTLGIALSTAAINVKSTYTDILNPVPFPTGFLLIGLNPAGIAAHQGLVDIAYTVGGGAEHIIAANLGVNAGTDFHMHQVLIPAHVPQGAVIRARWQRSNASLTMRVSVTAFATTDIQRISSVQTLGAATATSRGTSVDPGSVTANAKGAYSQLTATTVQPITSMILHFGNQLITARVDAQYLVDVAVGAAASESVVIPNIPFSISDTADEPFPNYVGPFPVNIPAGSRVSVRGQCTLITANRLFDVIAYGIA